MAEAETSVEIDPRVKKQIEFYFSDSNLPKDKFLLGKVRDKENPEGWVDIQLISTFKRMQDFGATTEGIAAAARTSVFLVVSEDGLKVRRSTELPDSDITLARSIMAQGFPTNTEDFSSFIDSLEKFFGQYGEVKSVRLNKTFPPKHDKAPPKGAKGKTSEKGKESQETPKEGQTEVKSEDSSKPIEVKDDSMKAESKETSEDSKPASEAMKTEPKPAAEASEEHGDSVKSEAVDADSQPPAEAPMTVETPVAAAAGSLGDAAAADSKPTGEAPKSDAKAEYVEKVLSGSAFIEFATKEQAEAVCKMDIKYNDVKLTMKMKADFLNQRLDKRKGDGKGDGKGDDRKGGKEAGRKRSRDEGGGEERGGREEKAKGDYVAYSKGVFVKLVGLGADATPGLLRDLFSKYGKVKFVEHKAGETEACVRFDSVDDAAAAVAGEKDAKTDICGAVPEVTLLTGEEEDAKIEAIKQRQLGRGGRGGGGRGGGRGGGGRGGSWGGRDRDGGGRGGGRGGHGGEDGGGERAAKAARVEA